MNLNDDKYHMLEECEDIEYSQHSSNLFWKYFAGIIVGAILSFSLHFQFFMKILNFSSLTPSTNESPFLQAASFRSNDIHYRSVGNLQLCSDGISSGYSDWRSLQNAIHETNILSASLALMGSSEWMIDDFGIAMPSLPPPSPETFVICPGAYLKGSNKNSPIFIDSENIVIDCNSCVLDASTTHLAFGKNAKGVFIRGLTFINARSSSLTFYHDGADVSFENCHWENNAGIGDAGAIADLNSTSSVQFFRCGISDSKQLPKETSITVRE